MAVKQRPTYSTNASSYPIGECTWGVKTLAPWAGDYWGNGAQWATSAAAAGFRTGSTPQVGAIACWNDGWVMVLLVQEWWLVDSVEALLELDSDERD